MIKEIRKTYLPNQQHSAKNVGSGDLEVLSTPSVIAFAENACKELISSYMDEGDTTVGIEMTMKHLAASKIGAEVEVHATLEMQEGKSFSFFFDVWEKKKKLAEGTHKRVKVNKKRFLDKL